MHTTLCNRIRCWLGAHDEGPVELRAVPDPNKLRYLITEQTKCTRCGHPLHFKLVGYARPRKFEQ